MDSEKNRNIEIERKFLVKKIPSDLSHFPHKKLIQGYLNIDPVIRVRSEEKVCFLTYKSGKMIAHEEYNLPIDYQSFLHLLNKCDGYVIEKTRYFIPIDSSENLIAELDIFEGKLSGLLLVEVEFSSMEEANTFKTPSWFGAEVSADPRYYNAYISKFGYKKE